MGSLAVVGPSPSPPLGPDYPPHPTPVSYLQPPTVSVQNIPHLRGGFEGPSSFSPSSSQHHLPPLETWVWSSHLVSLGKKPGAAGGGQACYVWGPNPVGVDRQPCITPGWDPWAQTQSPVHPHTCADSRMSDPIAEMRALWPRQATGCFSDHVPSGLCPRLDKEALCGSWKSGRGMGASCALPCPGV